MMNAGWQRVDLMSNRTSRAPSYQRLFSRHIVRTLARVSHDDSRPNYLAELVHRAPCQSCDEGQALQSHIVAMQDPIPSRPTFLLPPHDPVVLRFLIADIDAIWLS